VPRVKQLADLLVDSLPLGPHLEILDRLGRQPVVRGPAQLPVGQRHDRKLVPLQIGAPVRRDLLNERHGPGDRVPPVGVVGTSCEATTMQPAPPAGRPLYVGVVRANVMAC
jgi:hypothetical protein